MGVERFWEIDFLRGAAIVMMVASNVITDLDYFGLYKTSIGGFWWYFARLTAFVFIFLVGISLTLSHSRARQQGKAMFRKYLFRGLRVFSWGLIITAVTWAFMRDGFVVFGVLHLIGISIILAYPLIMLRRLNIILGAALIIVGLYLYSLTFSFPWLLWLGLAPAGFYSVDFFPLLPWFGVVLLGVSAGNLLYRDYKRRFGLPEIRNWFSRFVCYLGRHSLLIYLLHQPVIVALLLLFGIVSLPVL